MGVKKLRLKAKAQNLSIPSRMQLAGTVELQAANPRSLGKERLFLLANTGKPMDLEGYFDRVIVDLEGSTFDKDVTPVIVDHNTALRFGHSIAQAVIPKGETAIIAGRTVKGPAIAASAIRSSKSRVAQGIVDDIKNDFPFQVSIGATVDEGEYVEPGESVRVNGRTWKGPLIVARKTRIRELTLTVLGADNDTSTTIAAKTKLRKEKSVSFAAYVRSQGHDPKTLSAKMKKDLTAKWKKIKEQGDAPKTRKVKATAKKTPVKATATRSTKSKPVKASNSNRDLLLETRRIQAREAKRVADIEEVALQFKGSKLLAGKKRISVAQMKARAIKQGWSAEKFELECRRAEYPEQMGPSIQSRDRKLHEEALQCAILKAAQLPMSGENKNTGKKFGIEHMFSEKVLDESDSQKYREVASSIDALLDLQIRAAGRTPTSRTGSTLMAQAHECWTMIKASGHSILNLVHVFENTMHKATLAGFQEAEGVWSQLCARRPVSDFRPHNLYRLEAQGSYKKIGIDGELKHVGMTDTKYSIQAETYGAMITIDRKTQINDDLGVVMSKARSLGILGAQRIEESVFVLLLSNPGSFFSVGNNNLLSGVNSPLGFTSLDTARLMFRNQVVNGKPVSVSPSILLVGTKLETLARKIYSQDRLAATGDTDARVFTDNEFKGLYTPIVSPYLDNTNITDQDGKTISGQSNTQWYLLASPNAPQGAVLVIGFLNGRETPYFDQAETQFNVPGGIQFRSYHDWGVAMHVHEMGIKSTGT